jgi:hypothetical protein
MMQEGNVTERSWLFILGEEDEKLASEISSFARRKLAEDKFTDQDLDYIAKLDLGVVDGRLEVRAERLEQLRRLCRLCEVDFRAAPITSHRPVIGHLIVAAKRAVIPLIRALLREPMRQQRDFNAAAICLLAEISNELEALGAPDKIGR